MKTDISAKSAPAKPRERLSSVVENYLLSLYILKEEQQSTVLAQLAAYIRRLPASEGLGTTLPSILGMLRRMSRDELVRMSAKKEIEFTEKGAQLAAGIARRHRLAERLVVDVLGVELPRADEEAHQLEHGISPYLEERIRIIVNSPKTCPFGKPIPGSGYKKPVGKVIPMSEAKPGVNYRVISLPDEDPKLLAFLCRYQILPGEEIKILELGDYRDVITFETPMGETAVGFLTASRIYLNLISR
jgi:DtxR family Mn-dependent transcriptional regulator